MLPKYTKNQVKSILTKSLFNMREEYLDAAKVRGYLIKVMGSISVIIGHY